MKKSILIIAIILSGCCNEKVQPAVYVDWSDKEAHSKMVIGCLGEKYLAFCIDIANQTYGIDGFKRGKKVLPCTYAETEAEKEACGND